MRQLRPILAINALLITIPAWSATPPNRPHVVELLTSQGCSSCPPADALLGELIARPDVIALAFHVDYWNSLGWRDPYSMSAATQRQSGYVDALGLSSAFTPQIVIDGHASLVGSDRRRIAAALAPPDAGEDAVPIEMHTSGGELLIALPDGKNRERCTVTLAAYLPKASTAIGRGENSGRTLVEYNVVRQVSRLGTWDGRHSEYKISLGSLPADATQVAILLQRDGQRIVGAASLSVR